VKLTPEQRKAVSDEGNVCLVSCPGSGKTRAIIAKLLRAVEEVRGSTRRIACITHTNAASDEIDSRLRAAAFSGEDAYYEVSTIHAFCLRNIVGPFHRLLPEFRNGVTIVTSEDDEYEALKVDMIRQYALDRRAVADGFDQIQRQPDGSIYSADGIPDDAAWAWCEWWDKNNRTTLNDLVHHACRIVDSYTYITSAIASRFAWMLVDEFQDSSASQVHLLRAVHAFGRTRFFCVGDPNQAIYGFAGSSPNLLRDFAQHVSAKGDYRLTGNFRSSLAIVSAAERLCPNLPPMDAVGEYRDYPESPRWHQVESSLQGILEIFWPAVRGLDVPLGKTAILAAWWMPLYHLARDLRQRGIPVIGPGARPYRRSHLFAGLAESVGAYLEEPDPDAALAVQRSLFQLFADLGALGRVDVYSYAGRVLTCELLQAAKEERSGARMAVEWLERAAGRIAAVLVGAQALSMVEAALLRASAGHMVREISQNREAERATVEHLGIFARPKKCMQLMTVHKAKGREFEAVAIIEAHRDRFPHFSVWQMTDPVKQESRYNEARRVVYVGVTRAQRVMMVFTDMSEWRNRPSPFLDELGLVVETGL
jgi:DNA helicase II / ATP-dependent DNA helicase PcrA